MYKGTRFNEKVILDVKTTETFQALPEHISPFVTHWFVKGVWEVFQISKERLMDRGYQQKKKRKIAIRNKRNSQKLKSALLKQNMQRGSKRNVAFKDTMQALSVYYKRSFNGKVESHTKPTAFKEPPINSYRKGKSWQRTCLLEPKY